MQRTIITGNIAVATIAAAAVATDGTVTTVLVATATETTICAAGTGHAVLRLQLPRLLGR